MVSPQIPDLQLIQTSPRWEDAHDCPPASLRLREERGKGCNSGKELPSSWALDVNPGMSPPAPDPPGNTLCKRKR